MPDIVVMNEKCVRILDACVVSTMGATVDHLHYPSGVSRQKTPEPECMLCPHTPMLQRKALFFRPAWTNVEEKVRVRRTKTVVDL